MNDDWANIFDCLITSKTLTVVGFVPAVQSTRVEGEAAELYFLFI